MMPIINKLIRVTKNTETAIDHIFTNSVTKTKFKTGIIKSDISDNFPMFFVADYNIHIKETIINIKETKQRYIFTHDLSDISLEKFKYKLCIVSWDNIINSSDRNNAYTFFL